MVELNARDDFDGDDDYHCHVDDKAERGHCRLSAAAVIPASEFTHKPLKSWNQERSGFSGPRRLPGSAYERERGRAGLDFGSGSTTYRA
jgi:hypothetical protein